MDNFEAHSNNEALNALQKAKIKVKFLPPNTTAGLQPLDLSVNHAFKARIRSLLLKWQLANLKIEGESVLPLPKISKQELAKIIKKAWDDISFSTIRRAWIINPN